MFRARVRKGGWPRRLLIGALIGLGVYALIGFVVLPPIARRVAEKQLGNLLGRRVSITRVRVNPFALSLTIEGLNVWEPDASTSFAGFRRLYVNAQLSSIYRRAPVLEEIALDGLRVRVVRLTATARGWGDVAAYNFSDILARMAARATPSPPPDPDAPPPRFSLNNIRLTDGAVTFEDRPSGQRHAITDLDVGVPFVSTLPVDVDAFVQPGLRVRVDGTPFALTGRTKPFKDSHETLIELRLDALDLTRYLPFVPVRLPFGVESARLSLALDLSFVRLRADAPLLTVAGQIKLSALDLRANQAPGEAPLLRLEKLEVGIRQADLMAERFDLDQIVVSGLDAHVRRLADGSLNVAHLAPVAEGAENPSPPLTPAKPAVRQGKAAPGPRWSLGSFTVDRAVVHFRDEAVHPAFEAEVKDIAVSVRGLSNAPGASAAMQVSWRALPGGAFSDAGTLRLTPFAASGRMALEDVDLDRFGPYTRAEAAFDVLKGRLEFAARYVFAEEGGGEPALRISDGDLKVSDLALRRRDARTDFFRMAALAVSGAAVDVGKRTVAVDAISTHDARIRASRDDKGVVDLSTLGAAPSAGRETGVTARPTGPPAPAPSPEATPWTISLGRIDVDRWGARFEDRAVTPAAVMTIEPLALHASKLSTAPGARPSIDLRLGINKTGRFTMVGVAGWNPVAANLRFELRALEILPFQPYFAPLAGLTVTSGAVSIKGKIAVSDAKPQPHVALGADLEIADLATVDRERQEPLIKWRSFRVTGARVSNPPVAFAADEVAFVDLDARLVRFADGGLNVQRAFAPPEATTTPIAAAPEVNAPIRAAAPKPAPPAVSIGKLTIENGRVVFTDQAIQPRFSAELSELGCRVTGLSSAAQSTADVNLRAAVNRSGTLAISGRTNPLAKDLLLDLKLAVNDVELPPASAYAGKYAGYTIGKGKLDLALDYKVANRRLAADNRLILDQFTFGEKVASPDAVKLPVRLAVALLKDRHGIIDVDLPVSGSLDDPKFRLWPAVLKVLGNLVVKAATAPFSLIAAAFGGGDQLSRVDFAAGTATLDATAQRKLESLGKALEQWPGLSLELEGAADPGQDGDGLRRFLLDRRLKAQKMAELVQDGAAVPSADQLTLDDADRARLVPAVYKSSKFAKPTNGLGFAKSLPLDQMEMLLLANTPVGDDDLRALALRRATVLQSRLAKNAPSATGRLFLVTPRLGPDGGHVELRLKKD